MAGAILVLRESTNFSAHTRVIKYPYQITHHPLSSPSPPPLSPLSPLSPLFPPSSPSLLLFPSSPSLLLLPHHDSPGQTTTFLFLTSCQDMSFFRADSCESETAVDGRRDEAAAQTERLYECGQVQFWR